jgi:hypothetical protein
VIKTRRLLVVAALGAVAVTLALQASATAGVGVATCNQVRWCTVTASGDVTEDASQLAIGNASAGTALAVTQENIGQQQVGGELLDGSLAGSCGWSQYDRDWTTQGLSVNAGCANPVLNTDQFVANNGAAVWSGCYPRCFGGVPVYYERHCSSKGHNWCYSSNCEEFANFYPWSPDAHPGDPVRMTARHVLDVRYLARYGDAWTKGPFYLIRDIDVAHGTGNWVFVSGAACGIRVGHAGSYHWLPRPTKPAPKKSSGPSAHAASAASA